MYLNLNKLNQISKMVEDELKENGILKSDGSYNIPADLFIDTLLHEDNSYSVSKKSVEGDYGELKIRMAFTNPRISKKVMSVYLEHYDLIPYNEWVGNVYQKIYNTIQDDKLEYINIFFEDYRENRDYISKLVFLIDKECSREIFEAKGLKYNRGRDDKDAVYLNPLGDEIRLDQEFNMKNGSVIPVDSLISDEDRLCKNKEGVDDEENIECLMKELNFNEKQKVLVRKLFKWDFNQTKVAKELGIDRKTVRRQLDEMSTLFEGRYEAKTTIPVMERLDNMLENKVELNEMVIANFIKHYIDKDGNLSSLVYNCSTGDDREPMIRLIRGDEGVTSEELKPFIICFLKNYYENYRK